MMTLAPPCVDWPGKPLAHRDSAKTVTATVECQLELEKSQPVPPISVRVEPAWMAYADLDTGSFAPRLTRTKGLAFSHGQARKILLAKSIATFAALAISVPYWKMLGLIGG
jgi:hypothetical protein